MHEFNLAQLHAFAEVVEAGSFSGAAERLNLTQPAISLRVRQLEERLGVRLVERVGKRVTPTAAGAQLLVHSGRIEGAVASAMEALAPYATGQAGRVRLGTGATACIYVLPSILRSLRRRMPALELVVRTGNTTDILKLVEENRLDVALVTTPAPGRIFEVTPVLSDELVVIAPADDDALPHTVTPGTLSTLPLVLYEPGGHSRRLVDDWFARAGIAVKPIMELGSVEAIKELVGAGLGYAILPGMAVREESERAAIVARPLSPLLHRELALVVRRDKPVHRGLEETIETLRAMTSSR
ncbi:LysR family transcriptional regulator [Phytoactinopolyspora mesophila]|uniref:LysR family transcriptional regulator n=1 Tax=Phytoactinopolyspora mesophila TaxID=2650750 RepID=A0A7K3M8D8_9ACTN|nr:LysR family transcriptional regulator [Phytoactinopolyspora mesophila]NDL58678.1 LysR family transcriptional regulator [Phytoactinopolyspora mesophila]